MGRRRPHSFRMAEESAAPSTSANKTESMDVDAEAKKYLGLGQKNLVMGDIPAAVNAFQEAASLLANKYGETGNECAEAYFFYGKSLLELARMENGVLGNALEGVQVEEEEEKTEDSMVESADNIDEEAREELREQVYNAMGEKDESRKNPEESLVHTGVEMQLKDVEMEEVREEEEAAKEEKTKAAALGGEDTTVVEEKEEQEKAEKQVEAAMEEQNVNEVTTEVALEDGAAREEKPVDAEGTAGEDKPVVVEEAREDDAVHRVVVSEDAAVKVNPVIEEAAEAAGGDSTLEKQVPAEEAPEKDKVVKIAAQEKTEEVEKQADTIVEKNPIVEELVKASGELEREFMTAVEKVEGQAEKAEQQPAKAAEKTEDMKPATEQVVVNLKEKEETLDSREVKPSAPNETTPSGSIKQSHEIQPEEKAEVAPKVEKEEEKDDEMGEGEEMEGSEEEDKVEEDKENDSAVEEDKENDSAVEEDKENDSAAEEDKENDSTVEEKESEEDDVGNLELAWDMLELAKVIYKRQDTKEAQLLVAQAHLKLGEVSIESENYSQAIEEFRSCLALQQKYLEAHDRLLAETHYHLGLAFHYDNQYDEAVLQYSKSMEVIDKRMAMLTERLKAKGEGSAEDEKEIVELEGLLPEIKEKIEDSKESQKSARIAELALKATLVGGSSSSFPQATESNPASAIPAGQKTDGAPQCITDISHLVRKKRKPEEETQQGDNEAKKSKPEPAVNGGGDATPSGNEVAEKKEEEAEERPQVETVQSAV
ncbi:nuclear autoantigenic sperm protein isoform X2 [Lacerta agilis]|uniref:nuclear autoantigenic sperm protein isoform X2 n=1 Tax=Lacerta agilis TaxID=80427 RepID=UPI00141922A9|nr:nuclear autoantigenic sperm protein isoform X2 [Lacerta agilis]